MRVRLWVFFIQGRACVRRVEDYINGRATGEETLAQLLELLQDDRVLGKEDSPAQGQKSGMATFKDRDSHQCWETQYPCQWTQYSGMRYLTKNRRTRAKDVQTVELARAEE